MLGLAWLGLPWLGLPWSDLVRVWFVLVLVLILILVWAWVLVFGFGFGFGFGRVWLVWFGFGFGFGLGLGLGLVWFGLVWLCSLCFPLCFLCVCVLVSVDLCSTRPPGGNQVDSLPPVVNLQDIFLVLLLYESLDGGQIDGLPSVLS